MKKSLGLIVVMAAVVSSCVTTHKTAKTIEASSSIQNVTVADLQVGERITCGFAPAKEIQRGGLANVKRAAEQRALKENGNADVLLDPQYVISTKRSIFGSKVIWVEVSGRPAFYKNFRSLSDSVWNDPVFRGLGVKHNINILNITDTEAAEAAVKAATQANKSYAAAFGGNKVSFGNGGGFAGKLGGSLGGNYSKKSSKPKKERNPYRSLGLHTHIDGFWGPGFGSGHATDYMIRDEFKGGGISLTIGNQSTENFFVGAGIGIHAIDGDGNESSSGDRVSQELSKLQVSSNTTVTETGLITEKHVYDLGYDGASSFTLMPVYLDLRYYLSPKKLSLFADLKVGAAKEVKRKWMDGGFFFSPTIGFSFGRFELGCTYSVFKLNYSSSFSDKMDDYIRLNTASGIDGGEPYYYGNPELKDFMKEKSWINRNVNIHIGFRL